MATQNTNGVSSKTFAEALAAFQAESPTFTKNKTARVQTRTGGEYTYKYADLGDILPVIGPLLAKHGLSWSAKPGRAEDGELVLRYRLLHISGEADADEMPLGVESKCKPQELGSAITYARRYAITAQLNLTTDEDDDGRAANESARTNGRATVEPTAAPVRQTERVATAKQRSLIFARASEHHMPASVLANIVLAATANEARDFASEDAAQEWLKRGLDRLPGAKVDAVLEGIAAEVAA